MCCTVSTGWEKTMLFTDGNRILVGLFFLLLAVNMLKKLVYYDRRCEEVRRSLSLVGTKRFREVDLRMRLGGSLLFGITVAFTTYGLNVILQAIITN